MDSLKRSGSTQKMLEDVASVAKEHGDPIMIVCATLAHRSDLMIRFAKMTSGKMVGTNQVCVDNCRQITFEVPGTTLSFDWRLGQVRDGRRPYQYFVDHYTVEHFFRGALTQWVKYRIGKEID